MECWILFRPIFVDDGFVEEVRDFLISVSELKSGRVVKLVPRDEELATYGSLIVDDEPPNLLVMVRPIEHGVSR